MQTTLDDVSLASAACQAELVRSGAVSCRELVELYLRRIERLEPKLGAYTCVRAERALEEADAAQARLRAGDEAPLLGVPIAVKANLDVTGELASHGSAAATERSSADCEVVRRLRTAGAIVLGQTTLNELAVWGHFTASRAHGVTRNPWDIGRSPGGSSGGSAVAVAAGLAAAALGTDGGGSIRIPAACCGLFGLKPQRGRISLLPLPEHWLGLTHVGPLTRSVEDAALLCDALMGPARGDAVVPPPPEHSFLSATQSDPAPLRIAFSLRPALPASPSAEALLAVEQTVSLLEELGHEVEEHDPDYGDPRPLFTPRWARGVWEDAQRLHVRGRLLEPRTRSMVRLGARMRRLAERARAREAGFTRRVNAVLADHDLLLTPAIAAPPPAIGQGVHRGALRTLLGGSPWVAYTPPWNLTGQPAATLPVGTDASGLPLSVQLVARSNDELTLLALAGQLERARPWTARPMIT